MPDRRYVAALLVAAACVVASIFFVGMAIDLDDTISPQNYLAKLNDRDTYGCKNSIRVDPDVLIFGDSHAYTGLNFNILAQEFGTQKIATCTLGSMFVESVLFALQHYESLGELPRNIIYATSTRAFWEERKKQEMLFSHKAQIRAIDSGDLIFSLQNLFAYLSRRDKGEYRDALQKLETHTPLIEAVDEDLLWSALRDSEAVISGLNIWKRRIAEAEFTPDAEKVIREIGELVERNNLNLYVIALPESPWLEREYPAWIRERYHELLRSFEPYAKEVLIYTAAEAGLGNRHFINRSLSGGYDYSKWRSEVFQDDGDFDADHMGGVGAVIFTRKVARDIGKLGH